MLIVITLLIFVVTSLQVNVAAGVHEINVVNSVCPPAKECLIIEECLSNFETCLSSDTRVRFIEKFYEIQEWSKDHFYVVSDASHLTISGNHSTISCSTKSIGFAFVNVTDLKIYGLRFVGCGGKMPHFLQSQLHLTGSDNSAFFMSSGTWVALLFGNINQLVLQQTEVHHSNGYGVLIVDSTQIEINSSNFSHNNHQVLKCYQGGINDINVSCCRRLPRQNETEVNCNGGNIAIINTDRAVHAMDTQTSILNTWITEGVNLDTQRYFNENYTYTAGGLSLFADHSSYSETVLISHCMIARNIGYNGANTVMYIHDNIGSNYRVRVTQTQFRDGNVGFQHFEKTARAGGLAIQFGYVDEHHKRSIAEQIVRKEVSIEHSTFIGNHAFTAAAILLHSYIARDKSMQATIFMNNCTISENFGYDTICTVRGNIGNRFYDLKLHMTDVRLTNNKLLHQVSLTDPLLAYHHSPHISTLHTEGFSTVTCVRIVVHGNQMRGISTKQNTDFRFQDVNIISDNRGVEGGAIHI